MKGTGYLTIVGCGLMAAFLFSLAGPALSAAPRQEAAAAMEGEEEKETDREEAETEKDACSERKTMRE